MLRSLRFQLPALFLLGVVLAGLVSAAIALRLVQTYAQNQARSQDYSELTSEVKGLTELYSNQAGRQVLKANKVELATGGDRIFYRGISLFPGQGQAFEPLPRSAVNLARVKTGPPHATRFTFTPPGDHRVLLAVARPLKVGGHTFGVIAVAKPQTVLGQHWLALIERLLLAFAAGIVVAAGFAWYLSRRITSPVLQLSEAADEIAGGRYEVDVPTVPGGGEIGHLAGRFREMAARLAEAEQLERNFLMTVSHELRTPLTAIRGHVGALSEGVVTDEETRQESLAVISAEAARLERLVGDVLDLAKLGAHRFTVLREEVEMERLVDRAYVAFSEEARRRGIDYRCEVEAKPVIVSDGDRVLQIISNLLSNAFRWTPDGGRVGVELSATDGTVYVSVDDSGPGIRPSERERIFRPFWSRGGGGTGLGLAIARELALALGGHLRLETSSDRGSRFELVLPTQPR
jgi:two-component system sensor histidine kinase BaeS